MFTEAIAPIGNAINRINNAMDSTLKKEQDNRQDLVDLVNQSHREFEKTQYQQYNAETRRMNAQAKLDSIAYANRLADMSQQQGRHIANVAGGLQMMAGGPNSPVQITPQGVQIPPQ